MNINKIIQIVNSDHLSDDIKEQMIISVLADDPKVIPIIMEILEHERSVNKELLLDSNVELSLALITLQDPNIGKTKPKPYIELDFVINEIKKHYLKWADKIRCCFNVEGLP